MGGRVIEPRWYIVAADILRPLLRNKNGFQYLLVVYQVRTIRALANSCRTFYRKIIKNCWETPKFFIKYNGTEFFNNAIEHFAKANNLIIQQFRDMIRKPI